MAKRTVTHVTVRLFLILGKTNDSITFSASTEEDSERRRVTEKVDAISDTTFER